MIHRGERLNPYLPEIGCALLLGGLVTLFLLPFLFVGALEAALAKLHLGPMSAMLCVAGILLGGFINVPLCYLQRESEQLVTARGWHGWMNRAPFLRRTTTETIIAVNVGGCVVPTLLAVYELAMVLTHSRHAAWAVAVAAFTNILVCYWIARPIAGVGIAMPGFVSPFVSISLSWMLLMPPEYQTIRAPVAFIAGVAGPLLGADLLHLRDLSRVSAGVLSVGGAGTFDGIVLSGIVAALLA